MRYVRTDTYKIYDDLRCTRAVLLSIDSYWLCANISITQGSAQSADGDSVRGGRPGARGRGKGRGRGSRGRGGRGANQAAAGGDASAVASSAATLGGGGAAAGFVWFACSEPDCVCGRCRKFGGSAGVVSSQPLGQAGPVSGASSAGATAATAPSAYSATWSGWNADSLPSTPSAGAQP